jgi:hypothetical protein
MVVGVCWIIFTHISCTFANIIRKKNKLLIQNPVLNLIKNCFISSPRCCKTHDNCYKQLTDRGICGNIQQYVQPYFFDLRNCKCGKLKIYITYFKNLKVARYIFLILVNMEVWTVFWDNYYSLKNNDHECMYTQ